jgi:hypothetical protein
MKTQSNIGKTNKYYTNYGMTNHNVETCRKNKEQTIVATTEVAQPNQEPHKTSLYACHICGLNGHKMTSCPKFVEMQKMFHGKSMVVAKVQLIVKTQKVTVDVNVVDVNVTTRSNVFKDRKTRKTKSFVD